MLEGLLLKDNGPNYPVFMAKVPKDLDFVHEAPAYLFFIAYGDVWKLFHSRQLDYNLVLLYALNLAMKIKIEATPYVTVENPYYMRDSPAGGRTRITDRGDGVPAEVHAEQQEEEQPSCAFLS